MDMANALWQHIANFLSYNNLQPLLFTHVEFWIFFLVLGLGLLFLDRRYTARVVYLFTFSLLFYYKSCGLFFLLILLSICFNYAAGLLLGKFATRRKRKAVVVVAVSLNLLLLAYFKYTLFFVTTLNDLFDTSLVYSNLFAQFLGWFVGDSSRVGLVLLPVGISFYTFQAISYVVDIYRGDIQPLRRIVDFGFYLSFFPQLIAGPIVRASEFIPQISKPNVLQQRESAHALFLILVGLFKKIILSDYLALNLVDRVFNNPLAYSGVENLMASYGYTLQIYCDFSGYTDIAIGIALLLGYRLSLNFNFPYKATSLSDFWRRWHISLSTWLRDYLYIPLGGNRHGRAVMWMSLLLTMLLGGLWHGADWTFVFWGAAHGLGLVVSKSIDRLPRPFLEHRVVIIARKVLCFHYVVFLWIFFRASSFSQALDVLEQIAWAFDISHFNQFFTGYWVVSLLLLLGYFLHWMPSQWVERLRGAFITVHWGWKFAVTLLVALLVLRVQTADLQPFIYFDF
jgi:alginate O-acetylation protein